MVKNLLSTEVWSTPYWFDPICCSVTLMLLFSTKSTIINLVGLLFPKAFLWLWKQHIRVKSQQISINHQGGSQWCSDKMFNHDDDIWWYWHRLINTLISPPHAPLNGKPHTQSHTQAGSPSLPKVISYSMYSTYWFFLHSMWHVPLSSSSARQSCCFSSSWAV